MSKRYSSLLFFLFVLCACNDVPKNNRYTQEQINSLHIEKTKVLKPNVNSIKKLDLNPFLGKKTEFDFGSLVEEVKLIPLETTNESLVDGIYKIITTDEYIYIMDKYKGRNVIIFDRNGKFIKRFKQGQGPGEFSRLYDVDYDFNKNELVAYQHSFLLFFDKIGNFLRQERLPLGFNNFVVTDDGYIFKTLSKQGGNLHLGEKEKYTLLVTDKKFELNFASLPQYKEIRALSAYTYLYKNDNLLKITGEFTDSIYSYNTKTNELTTEFVLDYDKKLPKKYIYTKTFEEFDNVTQNNDYYFNIGDYFETSSQNVFFLMNNYSGLQTIVYRDKKTGNMVGGTNADYDVKEIPPIAFPKAVYKDYFVSTYVPSSNDYSFLKDSKFISAEDKEKIKQSQDEDNPVLVYFKLKEF